MSIVLQNRSHHHQYFGQIYHYTQRDEEVKQSLIDSMIDNLLELQQALYISTMKQDPQVFLRAVHKAKTTLSILDNRELSVVLEELKSLTNRRNRIVFFDGLCSEIIRSLREGRDRNGIQLIINL